MYKRQIGLLVNDAERQAGIMRSQQTAMLESDKVSAIIGMNDAFEQNRAADKQAEANIGFNPEMPYLPSMPDMPTFAGLAIDNPTF